MAAKAIPSAAFPSVRRDQALAHCAIDGGGRHLWIEQDGFEQHRLGIAGQIDRDQLRARAARVMP